MCKARPALGWSHKPYDFTQRLTLQFVQLGAIGCTLRVACELADLQDAEYLPFSSTAALGIGCYMEAKATSNRMREFRNPSCT